MNGKVITIGLGVLLLTVIGSVGMIASTYTPDTIDVIATANTPSTIETARIAGDKAREIELDGRELGLICITNAEGCAELIARAEKNPQLKAAFLKVKTANVRILPLARNRLSVGYIGNGYVVVNTLCSDEKIITFLTK